MLHYSGIGGPAELERLCDAVPTMFAELAERAALDRLAAATYTPGMAKPIPLARGGWGWKDAEAQREQDRERKLKAAEFVRKQDEEWRESLPA